MSTRIILERDIPARMRDGTVLYADVYRPETVERLPVLLMRLPYDKTSAESGTYLHPEWYARRGYIVAVQDCRGRYRSEGEWYPYRYETDDGYDSVEWAAALPGANGRVGMYGFSYVGATQLLAAVAQPPSLKALAPALTGADYYQGWTYEQGAFSLAFIQSWTIGLMMDTARRSGNIDALQAAYEAQLAIARVYGRLPLTDPGVEGLRELAPYYLDWLQHPSWDAYWQQWSIHTRYERITVPALHIAGWYDVFLEGTLQNYEGLRRRAGTAEAREGQRLLVGPWYHMPWAGIVGQHDFGEEAGNVVNEAQRRWFDWTLKGDWNGLAEEPPVRVFVMGENRWRSENEWPPRRARTVEYYLHSDGAANSLHGDGSLSPLRPGDEPPDTFVYHAGSPVPSTGGHSCCYEELTPMGAYDQRKVEARNDVLCYTTGPLPEDLEVTGWVTCRLWAATEARDADWTVRLVDVFPDGRAINLTEGVVRAAFRDSLEKPSPLEPGEIYEYRIPARATSNVFRAGHRIRVEISSSSFPMYDRNPGTAGFPGETRYTDLGTWRQTVFHDGSRPSHLLLPVVRSL